MPLKRRSFIVDLPRTMLGSLLLEHPALQGSFAADASSEARLIAQRSRERSLRFFYGIRWRKEIARAENHVVVAFEIAEDAARLAIAPKERATNYPTLLDMHEAQERRRQLACVAARRAYEEGLIFLEAIHAINDASENELDRCATIAKFVRPEEEVIGG